MAGVSIHDFQVQGVNLQGPSEVLFTISDVHLHMYLCYQEKCVTRNFNGYRVKHISGSVHGTLIDTPSTHTRGYNKCLSARFSCLNLLTDNHLMENLISWFWGSGKCDGVMVLC